MGNKMRFLVVAALSLAVATPALAGDPPYLYDLVKQKSFRTTYVSLLGELKEPPEFVSSVVKGKSKYLAFPIKTVKSEDSEYTLALVCEPQTECAEYGAVFLFTPDGKKGWGAVRTGDDPEIYLGTPSEAQKKVLDNEFDNPD